MLASGGEKITVYRASIEHGNVQYSDFIDKVTTAEDQMQTFGWETAPNSEFGGDIVESWMGLFDVANMTRDLFNIVGDKTSARMCADTLETALNAYLHETRDIQRPETKSKRNKKPNGHDRGSEVGVRKDRPDDR